LFISHGGGPWPFVDEMKRAYAKTARELAALPQQLPEKPKAVLVVSGHWEEREFKVGTSERPPMIFDYYGFPEHTYQISYPAPGSPELASRVRSLIESSGIKCQEDPSHGLDHGIFIPLYLMYPNADVPIVPLSLKSSYDPAEHIRLGEALRPLREEGVLIIGSGLSYHNMRGFRTGGGAEVSETFESWLNETISQPSAALRNDRLVHWEKAPSARLAHPQEDHLLPLMVVAGVAGEGPGRRIFIDHVMGVAMASYRFDA
jgi:aromatic ring-opening dioxygenase catalytic subunit (LigB family)